MPSKCQANFINPTIYSSRLTSGTIMRMSTRRRIKASNPRVKEGILALPTAGSVLIEAGGQIQRSCREVDAMQFPPSFDED
jgi:predicted molibdopterin-dependent oxidoreductase YjgC